MASYKAEGINLRSRRFSEADKLMTVFTREHGKISAIAKSACKTSSKYGGRLEVFGHNTLFLAKGKNLDILSQAETIENFYKIREDEYRLNAGLYMVKLLYYFLEERVRNEPLFDLCLGCLRKLKSGADPKVVTRIFDVRLADIEGFLPIEDFSGHLRPRLSCIMDKDATEMPELSQEDLRDIDFVLIPGLCEHVGKDVASWKNM